MTGYNVNVVTVCEVDGRQSKRIFRKAMTETTKLS